VLLLTGATGQVGGALLHRLIAAGTPVRCLVRDPAGLGGDRVRVQIALGDLTDPPSFRNALRGVKTVVHMAASARDQPRGSIEELNGIATWRLVTAAERAGVEHFVFFSALSASVHDRTRFLRSKALAEQAVVESGLRHTVFAPSLVLDARDRLSTLIERLAMLPAVPVPGRTQARFQPILGRRRRRVRRRRARAPGRRRRPLRARRAGHAHPGRRRRCDPRRRRALAPRRRGPRGRHARGPARGRDAHEVQGARHLGRGRGPPRLDAQRAGHRRRGVARRDAAAGPRRRLSRGAAWPVS
jgi:uncharacterized protein YbjT (DUF2867 family)